MEVEKTQNLECVHGPTSMDLHWRGFPFPSLRRTFGDSRRVRKLNSSWVGGSNSDPYVLHPLGHFFFSQNNPSQEDAGEQVAQRHEEKVYQSRGDEDLGDMGEDEEAQFQMLMDRLGAQKVLEE